jgi:hypothetical protein
MLIRDIDSWIMSNILSVSNAAPKQEVFVSAFQF